MPSINQENDGGITGSPQNSQERQLSDKVCDMRSSQKDNESSQQINRIQMQTKAPSRILNKPQQLDVLSDGLDSPDDILSSEIPNQYDAGSQQSIKLTQKKHSQSMDIQDDTVDLENVNRPNNPSITNKNPSIAVINDQQEQIQPNNSPTIRDNADKVSTNQDLLSPKIQISSNSVNKLINNDNAIKQNEIIFNNRAQLQQVQKYSNESISIDGEHSDILSTKRSAVVDKNQHLQNQVSMEQVRLQVDTFREQQSFDRQEDDQQNNNDFNGRHPQWYQYQQDQQMSNNHNMRQRQQFSIIQPIEVKCIDDISNNNEITTGQVYLTEQQKEDLKKEYEEIEKLGESLWITDQFVNHPFVVVVLGGLICFVFTLVMVYYELYMPSPQTLRDYLDYSHSTTINFDAREAALGELQSLTNPDGKILSQSVVDKNWLLAIALECIDPDTCPDGNVINPRGLQLLKEIDELIVNDKDWGNICLRDTDSKTKRCADSEEVGGMTAKASPLSIFKQIFGEDLYEPTQFGIDFSLFGLAQNQKFFDYVTALFSKEFNRNNRKAKLMRMVLTFATPVVNIDRGIVYSHQRDRQEQQETLVAGWQSKLNLKIRQLVKEKYPDFQSHVFGKSFYYNEFNEQLVRDVLWSGLAVILVLSYVCFHVKSIFVGSTALSMILLSFPITLVFYKLVLKISNVSSLHLIVTFLILGISADNIFVLWDGWTQSDTHQQFHKNLKKRMAYTFRRSSKSLLATSSTTAFAFLSNGFSALMPVSAFGFFAFIIIPVNYLLIIMYFPAFIIIYENHVREIETRVLNKVFFCFRKKKEPLQKYSDQVELIYQGFKQASSLYVQKTPDGQVTQQQKVIQKIMDQLESEDTEMQQIQKMSLYNDFIQFLNQKYDQITQVKSPLRLNGMGSQLTNYSSPMSYQQLQSVDNLPQIKDKQKPINQETPVNQQLTRQQRYSDDIKMRQLIIEQNDQATPKLNESNQDNIDQKQVFNFQQPSCDTQDQEGGNKQIEFSLMNHQNINQSGQFQGVQNDYSDSGYNNDTGRKARIYKNTNLQNQNQYEGGDQDRKLSDNQANKQTHNIFKYNNQAIRLDNNDEFNVFKRVRSERIETNRNNIELQNLKSTEVYNGPLNSQKISNYNSATKQANINDAQSQQQLSSHGRNIIDNSQSILNGQIKPQQAQLSSIEMFFGTTWNNMVRTFRWPIVLFGIGLAMFAYERQSRVVGLQSMEQYFFPSHHNSIAINTFNEYIKEEQQGIDIVMDVMWGIDDINKTLVDFYNASDIGTVVWDREFDMTPVENQQFVDNFCQHIKTLNEILSSARSVTCWTDDFKSFLKKNDQKYPLVSRNKDLQTNYFYTWLYKFIREDKLGIQYFDQNQIGMIDGRLVFMRFQAISKGQTFDPYLIKSPVWLAWEREIDSFNQIASKGINKVKQTAGLDWGLMFMEKRLFDTQKNGTIISMSFAMFALLIATGNIIQAFLAAVTITLILFNVMAVTNYMGWDLGMGESVGVIACIGFAVDYVVHLASHYIHSKSKERNKRMQLSLQDLGVSIIGGTLTTIMAALTLYLAELTLFFKFATFVISTIIFALFYSLCFFASLCHILAPQGEFGNFSYMYRTTKETLQNALKVFKGDNDK